MVHIQLVKLLLDQGGVRLRHVAHVEQSGHKLVEVNHARAVAVNLGHLEELSHVLLLQHAPHLLQRGLQRLAVDEPVAVLVEAPEHALQLPQLAVAQRLHLLGGQQLERQPFHARRVAEVAQPLHVAAHRQRRVVHGRVSRQRLLEPGVIQQLCRRPSLLWIHHQHVAHHVLRRLAHAQPVWSIQLVRAVLDILDDGCVCAAVKWRVAAEQDVQHHARAPHVGRLAVVARQHLGRDVARGAYLGMQLLVWLTEVGNTPIDDFQPQTVRHTLPHGIINGSSLGGSQAVLRRPQVHRRALQGCAVGLGQTQRVAATTG
mmetsp:Transcript_3000/g.7420  ORF Transcript_3000/g.7420 Transcript_3000/m.7420 type:complete len:316 (+) Transcript_3000:1903-2850(+)